FMDDNLTLNKKRIIEICDLICRRGLLLQFETLNGLMTSTLDEEVVNALVSAGWIRGAIAIESGSDYIRNKVMKKRLQRDKIYNAVELISRHPHVYLKSYFIAGMPEDTNETLQETYDMINELTIREAYVTNVVPFPGTALFDQCVRDDLFIDDIDI